MRPRRQPLLIHGTFQQPFAIRGELAELPDVPRGHLHIGINSVSRRAREPSQLRFPRPQHSLPDRLRPLRFDSRAHFFVVHRRYVNMNVNPVHERSRNFLHVALDHWLGTPALTGLVIEKPARTGIHRRRQHKPCREGQRHGSARYANRAILQWLALLLSTCRLRSAPRMNLELEHA